MLLREKYKGAKNPIPQRRKIMEKTFLFLLLAVFLTAPAFGFSTDLSYATVDGDVCLAAEAVDNVGLGDPSIHYTNLTGVIDKEMTFDPSTGFWCGNIGRKISGKFAYAIQYNYSGMYFPHEYVKMGQVEGMPPNSFNPKEFIAVDNNGGGFNAVGLPIKK